MNNKPLVAHQNMKEFDPECELHHPLMIVKAVNPGCTIEIQIENAVTGRVTRLTSTEDPERDKHTFLVALQKEFMEAYSSLDLTKLEMES